MTRKRPTDGITRRDFMDGFACTVLTGSAAGTRAADRPAPGSTDAGQAGSYPPGLTGWRGSRPEDLSVAHRLRDGTDHYAMQAIEPIGEVDCCIVGAGIGGLAAAWFVHQQAPRARLLILDNHDDFGGHARRNEFRAGARTLIGYGGSETIQSPGSIWSPQALGLLRALGVRLERFETALDHHLYPDLGMSSGLFFAREDFGVDRLVTGDPQRALPTDIPPQLHRGRALEAFWADAPLSETQRRSVLDLHYVPRNPYAHLNREQVRAELEKISYADYLTRYRSLDPTTLKIFTGRTRDLFALSGNLVSAAEAASLDLPGFRGLDLKPASPEEGYEREPYIHHFPDGNASIARLLVRSLIPGAAPGSTMEDIVTARFDYGALDRPEQRVRLRLSSTVTALRNAAGGVDVAYAGPQGPRRIRARHVIYAGHMAMLPYLSSEIGTVQRERLAANVRAPLVYVNLALRNWHPFVRAGVHSVVNPTGFYALQHLDYPVSLGRYRFARSPDEPIVLHLSHIPQPPTLIADRRASLRAARTLLYQRPFADFEAALRDELHRTVGAHGFDPDRDIAAITVNRWGHGYAYEASPLSDPQHPAKWFEAAREAIGHISIAGSDAAWSAYAHAAIDAGHRAAAEALQTLRS